jgi:bla regulator protein BlaR1
MMTRHLARNLNVRRRFSLLTIAGAALLCPALIAQVSTVSQTTQATDKNPPDVKTMAFDVVSIRPSKPDAARSMQWGLPDTYRAINTPLVATILVAYFPTRMLFGSSSRDRIVGAPPWVMNDHYDIVAKVAPGDVEAWQKQGSEKEVLHAMLQAALAERCKLVVHHTMVDSPAYALVVGKHGTKLKETPPGESLPPNGVPLSEGGMIIPFRRGEAPKITFFAASMASFAAELSVLGANRTVLDRTGLTGKYDFAITKLDTAGESESDPTLPSPWDLEEVGLKLVPITAPMETIVIDHIEKPSEN